MSRGKDKAAGVLEYFETVSLDKAEVVLAFAKRTVLLRQNPLWQVGGQKPQAKRVQKPQAKRGRKPKAGTDLVGETDGL